MTVPDTAAITSTEFSNFAHGLRERTPELATLTLKHYLPPDQVSEALGVWISRCKQLTAVTLPQHSFGGNIVSALAQLLHLKTVTLDEGVVHDEALVQLGLIPAHSFCALAHLDFSMSVEVATTFFQAVGHFPSLKIMLLVACPPPDSVSMRMLLAALAFACPNLTRLRLDFFPRVHTEVPPLGFEHAIRPLLECKAMTELDFGYDVPIAMETADIHELGRKWPSLTGFNLLSGVPKPDWPQVCGHPLSHLHALSDTCPNLRVVGLYFKEDQWERIDQEDDGSAGKPVIQKLQVNYSRLPRGSLAAAGYFVGRFVLPSFEVSAGPTGGWQKLGLDAQDEALKAPWKEVEDLARRVSRERNELLALKQKVCTLEAANKRLLAENQIWQMRVEPAVMGQALAESQYRNSPIATPAPQNDAILFSD